MLTGRVFWDHVWHKSKTSPCAMQECPSALSTISRMAPGHCQTSLSLCHPCGHGVPEGCAVSLGTLLTSAPAPRGCSPGTVLCQIRHCVSAALTMSQAELRQCLAGKGFPGFMCGPGCSLPPALLGWWRTGLLCHHLHRGVAGSQPLVPSVLPAFTGKLVVPPQTPRLPSVRVCSQ